MKAIVFLKNIRAMDAKINSDIEELARLEAMSTNMVASPASDRVQTSSSQQKMADCVAKIVDMQNELNDEIDYFINYKKTARNIIFESCDQDCISLLDKRYFGSYDEKSKKVIYKTWEQIAVEMDFTYQWVSTGLHQRALSQLQTGIDNDM